MASDNKSKGFEKPDVDEDYLMNVISGDETFNPQTTDQNRKTQKDDKPRVKVRAGLSKKADYEELFLVNRFPSGRNGKVVYIRPEYHERLLRIVQLTREEKTTLYSYIDNILEHHFREFGEDITHYFNERFKPIL
ncbi:DUF3408 domain-containing protein [Pedobacter alluvionis]|uniref:DUF3408 domain-containing protein n=1 Tax=Pedobacter alluvionis TaxID=475253 RepID=A0A497XY16_9SPHI|nr:DUF3408 domain-containing protein [Pedobacter alluvionis]RLJ75100.1 uncharacterized protein DUF3408 [Pedobacter alluvionis]TFB30205.1 DUF3408 domain-containing protein [Pedobacter alluvionis]